MKIVLVSLCFLFNDFFFYLGLWKCVLVIMSVGFRPVVPYSLFLVTLLCTHLFLFLFKSPDLVLLILFTLRLVLFIVENK